MVLLFLGHENTQNLIVDSIEGLKDSTVVVGSHADSVEDGPGINDKYLTYYHPMIFFHSY